MELKYPKIASGLKLIYMSWWVGFLGGIVEIILGIVLAFFLLPGIYLMLVLVGSSLFELVIMGMYMVGIYRAGKEERRYNKVLILKIAEIAIGLLSILFVVCGIDILLVLLALPICLFVLIAEPLQLCWLIKFTEELIDQEGDAGVSGYYRFIRGCIVVTYGVFFVHLFFFGYAGLPGILCTILILVIYLVVTVLYVIFLHNATRFLNRLEKFKSDDSWEKFNSVQLNKLYKENTILEEEK